MARGRSSAGTPAAGSSAAPLDRSCAPPERVAAVRKTIASLRRPCSSSRSTLADDGGHALRGRRRRVPVGSGWRPTHWLLALPHLLEIDRTCARHARTVRTRSLRRCSCCWIGPTGTRRSGRPEPTEHVYVWTVAFSSAAGMQQVISDSCDILLSPISDVGFVRNPALPSVIYSQVKPDSFFMRSTSMMDNSVTRFTYSLE